MRGIPQSLIVPLQQVLMGTLLNSSGSYTAVSADASASSLTIAPGVATISGFIFQIKRSGSVVGTDAWAEASGSKITITDAGSYSVTTGDVVTYHAW